MTNTCLWVVCATLFSAASAAAQDSASIGRKQASATNVANGTIRLDGRLSEEAWLQASPIADFIQKEPTEGAPPTDPMEVRFLYDESALYVGAWMRRRDEGVIQAPLGRRDNADQAEHILISLDTFLDRRTAVTFGVTAAGVRLDRYHPGDDKDAFDPGFDPVWEARTTIDPDGWTAELWIPFSQLRFNPQTEQVWGLNVHRFRPTLDEEDYWVLIPRTERAWASRFGELRGISVVRTTRRIELLPYVAETSAVSGDRDRRNPFDDGRNLASRVGVDFKMGLGPNLTLNATVNPDFGQVEADPAEVNLSAVPTRFAEKRPFFVEGAQLFNVFSRNLFYSRRIGAQPIAPASGDFVDYPAAATILAAAKLTGRLPSGTSLGFLSAITGEESARVFDLDASATSRIRVAARTMYGLASAQQEFGSLGSTATGLVALVHRDLGTGDPLADLLTRNMFTAAGDLLLRFRGGEYELRGNSITTLVTGSSRAIERIQLSSAHYAQRPDRTYSRLDPTLTSLSGFSGGMTLQRVSGRHWIWNIAGKVDSPDTDMNDLGQLNHTDGIQPTGEIRYRETQPGRMFRTYSIGVSSRGEWTWGRARQLVQFQPYVNFTWANFWTTSLSVSSTLPAQDASLTRGGPLMGQPGGWSMNVDVGNRSTSQTRLLGDVTLGGNEDGGTTRRVSGSYSFRPGPRWQLSINPFYEHQVEPQQYVATVGGGRIATYGKRYVFAYIERSTWSSQYRLGLTLKPDMNLDVYAEPFAASGRYYDFGELLGAGERDRLTYGTAGTSIVTEANGTRTATVDGARFALNTTDFKVLTFRSNVVLRWEWRPGSTLYLVWQQDRSGREAIGTRVRIDDMFRSASSAGTSYFIVKTSFWLPIK